MIELRLTMFEDGHPSRTFAFRIADQDLANARNVLGDLGPFKSPEVEALNNRRGQNDLVRRAVGILGNQMADFRDDRDGWNGERRVEIIAGLQHHDGRIKNAAPKDGA